MFVQWDHTQLLEAASVYAPNLPQRRSFACASPSCRVRPIPSRGHERVRPIPSRGHQKNRGHSWQPSHPSISRFSRSLGHERWLGFSLHSSRRRESNGAGGKRRPTKIWEVFKSLSLFLSNLISVPISFFLSFVSPSLSYFSLWSCIWCYILFDLLRLLDFNNMFCSIDWWWEILS